MHLADLFEHAVDLAPDRVAVVCGARRVTFSELEADANRLAHHLAEHGVGPGSHVGVQCRNSVEALLAFLAAFKLRAVPINVNYRLDGPDLRFMYRNADLVALVHDLGDTPAVAAAIADVANLRHVLVVDDGSGTTLPPEHGVDLGSALAERSTLRDFAPRSPDDTYILYTGGSTGLPKGVMWRHEDAWRAVFCGIDYVTGKPLVDEWAPATAGSGAVQVRLCPAPLIHGLGQVEIITGLLDCATVVLMPRFDPDEAWRAIERHRIALVSVAGDAMARPLIDAYEAGDYDASSVTTISSGSLLLSPAVRARILTVLPHVLLGDGIGCSEAGAFGVQLVRAGSEPTDGPNIIPVLGSIVIDDAGRPVPARSGRVGWLARTGHTSYGYYKDPERTAALFAEVDGARYVVPGDYARAEPDGTLTLLGRSNTSISTGGLKVFPEEVESALKSHPDVLDALVIGIADQRFGERVAAVVQPRPGATPDLATLGSHVRAQLAGFKAPRSLWLVNDVHRHVSGKPDYRWARRHAATHPAVTTG